ncbi:MAG: VWA domain-containing protein [Deltaproteobacteria bacterium]|nr:VWA domain-containing protein [Deltaproteobacteria bacterium]
MRLRHALIALVLVGCGDDAKSSRSDDAGSEDDASTPMDSAAGTDAAALADSGSDDGGSIDGSATAGCEAMDILFVIDDSGSMAEEQANLGTNFPRFVEVLDGYRTEDGVPVDYRLGVTTTGKDFTTVVTFTGSAIPPMTLEEEGPNGELLQTCGMTRKWIEAADGDVSATFSCVAEVGTDGSSAEMPLLMTETALTTRVADGTNAGFVREEALLAVVVLTDEDDCSLEADMVEITVDPAEPDAAADACESSAVLPVGRFLDALDELKGERGRWAGAVIAGPSDCSSAFGEAAAAPRLQQFATEAGENVVFSSICEGDLTGALMDALDTFEAACAGFGG